MAITQPKFNVSFKELAILAIQRYERGHVVLILDDSTAEVDKVTYRTFGEVKKTDYTTANYDLITLAFLGNPTKVTVIKKEVGSGADFQDTLDKLSFYDNYILCMPEADSTEQTAIISHIQDVRSKNDYSIAILGNATAPDKNYIVNFSASGDISAKVNGSEKTFDAGDYTARIAGALSGLASSRSLTYYELPELVDCTLSSDPDTDAENGKLVILHQDGSFKLGRAVNSLTTLTDGVTEAFQKIRVSNIMDMIANDIVATFRTGYVGKYVNNYSNKLRFCGAINAYLTGLAVDGLLEEANQNEVQISYDKNKAYLEAKGVDTSKMTYEQIIQANTGSKVLLDGVCSPTDAMEDLDLGMYLFQQLETIE